MNQFSLEDQEIIPKELYRNLSPAELYSFAIRYDEGAAISDKGALMLLSGDKTGRSPKWEFLSLNVRFQLVLV